LVIETTGAKGDQKLTFSPDSGFVRTELHVWRTDQMEQFIKEPDLALKDGRWSITVNPGCIYTLTTTTGQRKGDAPSPSPAPFPLPYEDDFERYAVHATPRYLCDQGGAFEAAERHDGGHCLRQQVNEPGIEWWSKGAAYAYSVLGDDHWNDISMSVDAAFETVPTDSNLGAEAAIGVLARWNPGATWIHLLTPNPAGYCLRLFADGRWELTTAHSVVATGRVKPPGKSWQRLALSCTGARIRGYLNGQEVADLTDHTYLRGLVGVYSGFHPALFDNLLIKAP
jgi:galactosylceramidase